MKKTYILLLMVILVFTTMTACSSNDVNRISKVIDIDISSGTISDTQDSHGGFHNDGLMITRITFTDDTEALENEIRNNNLWRQLPLSENISTFFYGDEEESGGTYISGEEGKPLLPNIENGYYFFKDRNSESKNPSDDSEILRRLSFNFTVAIYDYDTKTIYYVVLDT